VFIKVDWLQTVAAIIQIVGGIWVLVLGGKTVFDLVKYFQQRKPFRFSISSSAVSNSLSLVIIALLIGIYFRGNLSSQSNSAPTANSTSPFTVLLTPSPVQRGTALYQIDTWQKELNGWKGSSAWKLSNGMLINDGTNIDNNTLSPPYFPAITAYAVEATMQKIRCENYSAAGFGIIARGIAGWLHPDDHSASINLASNTPYSYISRKDSYDTDASWHTYRLEVKEQNITFFADNQEIMNTADNTTLTGGSVGLVSNLCQVDVKNFRIIAI
jgi:hypothetical protein